MTADPVTASASTVADLEMELHAINHLNASYWMQGVKADRAARAEYARRLERLEAIRRELAQLWLAARWQKGHPRFLTNSEPADDYPA